MLKSPNLVQVFQLKQHFLQKWMKKSKFGYLFCKEGNGYSGKTIGQCRKYETYARIV